MIIGLPPRPRSATSRLVGLSRPGRVARLWFDAQAALARFVEGKPDTYTVDIEELVAELGAEAAIDHRKDILYRQPFTETANAVLGGKIARILLQRKSEAKKCLVVDCDNTLWGGVIGEDGVGGVALSDDFPGRAFLQFQRQIKALRDSGVFIALCTKNNPDDVIEMFEKHEAMALSLKDVSVAKINWQPKSQNIKEIAAELNIGRDAIVSSTIIPSRLRR